MRGQYQVQDSSHYVGISNGVAAAVRSADKKKSANGRRDTNNVTDTEANSVADADSMRSSFSVKDVGTNNATNKVRNAANIRPTMFIIEQSET